MWDYQWEELMDYYISITPDGKDGDVVHLGLGDWCEIRYMGTQWVGVDPDWLL